MFLFDLPCEREIQEKEESVQKEYYKVVKEATNEWNSNGLETLCSLYAFIELRLRQNGLV